MSLAFWAALFCAVTTFLQLASLAMVAVRCRRRRGHLPPASDAPPVTIIRPVRGIENFSRETLGSSFQLDYPDYELLFCLDDADDPVAGVVDALIAAHPGVKARLLIGRDQVSANPKLNNVVKGWNAATNEWIVMADSNVLMPRDYIQRMQAAWRPDSGLVASMPVASRPENFWAEVECAFLNTFQARWQVVAEMLGFGFAQGKSMLYRKSLIEAGGGIRALGAEAAEDAATTKLIRAAGLSVHIVDNPFEQPLGVRTAPEIWSRQLRWARLRRITFPLHYVPELIVGCFFPVLAGAYAAHAWGYSVPVTASLLVALWLGSEVGLAKAAGWFISPRFLVALAVRDLILPALWVEAWLGDDFNWRGNEMTVSRKARGETAEAAEESAG